jgi:transcription antitermination factor NusG
MRWYVARPEPGKDEVAADHLKDRFGDDEVYWPMIEGPRICRGKPTKGKPIKRPVFVGYIFVHEGKDGWRALLRTTPGIMGGDGALLRFGDNEPVWLEDLTEVKKIEQDERLRVAAEQVEQERKAKARRRKKQQYEPLPEPNSRAGDRLIKAIAQRRAQLAA